MIRIKDTACEGQYGLAEIRRVKRASTERITMERENRAWGVRLECWIEPFRGPSLTHPPWWLTTGRQIRARQPQMLIRRPWNLQSIYKKEGNNMELPGPQRHEGRKHQLTLVQWEIQRTGHQGAEPQNRPELGDVRQIPRHSGESHHRAGGQPRTSSHQRGQEAAGTAAQRNCHQDKGSGRQPSPEKR